MSFARRAGIETTATAHCRGIFTLIRRSGIVFVTQRRCLRIRLANGIRRLGDSAQQSVGERCSGQTNSGQLDKTTAAILRNVISHGSSLSMFLLG